MQFKIRAMDHFLFLLRLKVGVYSSQSFAHEKWLSCYPLVFVSLVSFTGKVDVK